MLILSNYSPSILYLGLGIIVYFLYSRFGKKRKNYPPGPPRLPILGNLLGVGNRMPLAFLEYAKIYGPIFSLKMGDEQAVVIHGAKLHKEAYNMPVFNGRPDREAAGLFLSGSKSGIVLGQGESWHSLRRFTLRHLRDFGFGKHSLEGLIMDEVTELVSWIQAQYGEPIQLHRRFSLAVVNVLWTLLSGNRYAHDDPKLTSILDQLELTIKTILGYKGRSLLIFFFPKIAKIFGGLSGWNFLVETLKPRRKLFHDTIEEHERTLEDGHARDLIDAFLHEVQKTTDPTSVFHGNNAENALQSLMADFFIAGSDTTSTTLNWAVLYLLHNQDIQSKLQDELDRVIGTSRWPSLTDRKNLPYTEAFIMELLRITSIVANAPHCVTEDVEFHGYLIPKGTTVYSSLYASHHDPEVWADPDTFRPERFLSQDGTRTERPEAYIPFSTGKRVCLGEAMAKDQLFLFISSLAQRFHISAEAGKPKPTLDIHLGKLNVEPYRYAVVMKERL